MQDLQLSVLIEVQGVKLMSARSLCQVINATRDFEQNEVRYDNVLRDIKAMLQHLFALDILFLKLEDGVYAEYYQDGLNKGKLKEVYLNQDLALCYVAGKCAKVRLEVVKVFNQAVQQQPFALPKTYKEALIALVEAEEEKERLALEAEQAKGQLESLVKSHVELTLTAACKQLGYKPVKTMAYMREKGFLTKTNQPSSAMCGRGFFEVCSTRESDTRVIQQTRVTGAGLVWMQTTLRKSLPKDCLETNE
jgi:phage antirepressor YoqD-like protein